MRGFLEPWKRAHIIPLQKTTVPSSCSDFRPIAILSFISKVLRKIIHTHNQISEHLREKGILDPMQTGLRTNHSTETAILKLTEDMRMSIDKGMRTLLLRFDSSKASDTFTFAITR